MKRKIVFLLILFSPVFSFAAGDYSKDFINQLMAQIWLWLDGKLLAMFGIAVLAMAAWIMFQAKDKSALFYGVIAAMVITGATSIVFGVKDFSAAVFSKSVDQNGTYTP